MLQRTVRSQLARIERSRDTWIFLLKRQFGEKKAPSSVNYPSPMKATLNHVIETIEMLPSGEKHWFCGGIRSVAAAIEYLRKNEVIAVPTDTIYGFAALAQSKESIDRIYDIKGRDKTKPLAITLSGVTEIKLWADIDHVPYGLLVRLLPGPVTVVLKRTKKLNPALNPGHKSVGIRVPRSKFIRQVCKTIGQPIALTSANLSNEPSSLHPDEFSALWPRLGAVFYAIPRKANLNPAQRVGSTVVDLTIPGKFKILRKGVRFSHDLHILQEYCMRIKTDEEEEEDSVVYDEHIALRESEK